MVLVITGAAGDIGAACAKEMLQVVDVVLADIQEEEVQKLAEQLNSQELPYRAYAKSVDVANRQSVQSLMEFARSIGPIEMLFTNAGLNRRLPVEEITETDWDLVMDVHVKGTFLCCQLALKEMVANGKGVIVTMSSDYAVMAKPNVAAYCAAKSAIYSMTKSLAKEFAGFGLRVNALGPGPIDTALLKSGRTEEEAEEACRQYIDGVPMGRLGRPDEVATVLRFLLSDRSSYMTGQMIHPNGGQLVW